MDVFKGVFREEGWAMPLLVLSVITLCVLLLYTVACFCSWIKPSSRTALLPWLQMPFLLGLIWLTSTSIVAAVPLSDASCRMLFLGPGVGYVLLAAGLLSRIVQHTMRAHIVLHWLLVFFVVLNQMVISVAYLMRITRKNCQLIVHDQLLLMLYPALLVGVLLLLVYRTARRTRSPWKSREAIHVGLATTFGGAFAGCWIGAACVLGDALLSSCIGYGCLATVVVVSIISLIPKQERLELNDDNIFPDKSEVYYEEHEPQAIHKGGDFMKPRISGSSMINEPEIIIVPITSDGQVLPDIALQALKARNSHHHYHHESRKSREHGEFGRSHHHHQHEGKRPHRWHNKLRSDMAGSRRIKTHRSRKEATVGSHSRKVDEKIHRTPYNHRGWLY